MKCHEVRRYLLPWLDSELESALSLEIGRHMEDCGACRTRCAAESSIEEGILAVLEREGDDPAALGRVRRFVSGLPSGTAFRHTGRRRILAAAAAAVLVALASLVWFVLLPRLRSGGQGGHAAELDLAAEVFDHHRRFLDGRLAVVEGSSSFAGANAVFVRKLPFSFELRDPGGAGLRILGALVCRFRDVPTACVKALRDGEPVSVFILPDAGLQSFPVAAERFRREGDAVTCKVEGRTFAMVGRGGVVLAAVGEDVSAGELIELLSGLSGGR